jgi:hypothetical protein
LALCADLSLVFVVFLVVAWTVTWVLNVFRSLKPLPDPTAAIVFVSFAHRRGQKAGAKKPLDAGGSERKGSDESGASKHKPSIDRKGAGQCQHTSC